MFCYILFQFIYFLPPPHSSKSDWRDTIETESEQGLHLLLPKSRDIYKVYIRSGMIRD